MVTLTGKVGFDVAEFLVHEHTGTGSDLAHWMKEWGVTDPERARGGVTAPQPAVPERQVWLLQRKATRLGAGLGKTTGWIHRATLKRSNVEMLKGVNYERIDDRGLTISFGKKRQRTRLLEVDSVVLCTGQEPLRDLEGSLRAAGVTAHLIGGADVAAELDAKRAIAQAVRLASEM